MFEQMQHQSGSVIYKPGDLLGRDNIPVFILILDTEENTILYDIREQKSLAVENGHWLLEKLGYQVQK